MALEGRIDDDDCMTSFEQELSAVWLLLPGSDVLRTLDTIQVSNENLL